MTLLSTVQNAMALCGLDVPTAVYSSTDQLVKQMVRLLYVEGRDLLKRHDWNSLITVSTFTCGASNAQSGEPQTDFDRMSRGVDMWNTSSDWPIHGPISAEEWNELVVRSLTSLPQYWRIIGGVLNIEEPASGDTIRYEYISNKWILQAGVTAATTLSADTDTFRFPENLMELGLVWRWKQSKQLDYAEDMRAYQIHLMDAIQSDKGGRRVIMTDREGIDRRHRTWHGSITPA